MTKRQIKLNALTEWFNLTDSGVVNHRCKTLISALNSLSLKQIHVALKLAVGSHARGCNETRKWWAPKFHEQRNAKRELAKQLVIARNLIKRNHPGNFYLEVGEMDKAICKAMDLDYCNVTTADYERVLGILAK